MSFNIIESILVILLIAIIATVIFRYLKLPIVLGYVLVGTLVGPNVLNWLQNTQVVLHLAEFGVALLMFSIGLDFSLPRLFTMRHAAFFIGGLQVLLSIVISTVIGILLDMSVISAIVIGSIVAMSSTAIVLKQLSDQDELIKHHGTNAISILLFQDIAVIPILVFIASVKVMTGHLFWLTIIWSFLKGVIAIAIILGIGRWLLRPAFTLIVGTRLKELFTLCVIFVALGSSWLTNFFGLSYALGAFLAGIMLAESEYRQQIKAEILPFRDILLGLFFISTGMLVNVSAWTLAWEWIILLVIGLMLAKPLLIYLLCKFSNNANTVAISTGLVLGQGGEFGFAILTLAVSQELLSFQWSQSVLAALLISFIISPILIRFNQAIVNRLVAGGDNTKPDDH